VIRIRRVETLDAAGLPFPGAAQAAKVTRYTCDAATGMPTAKEEVYIITSLPPRRAGAARIAGYLRRHWAIEENQSDCSYGWSECGSGSDNRS
jgi:hypothetical protein